MLSNPSYLDYNIDMNKSAQITLLLLRVSLGALYFYAGITKILDKSWTAAGYIGSAKTFPLLYAWFGSTANIGWVNLANEWGLTLIGIALILGIFTRLASVFGIAMMMLYYFAILQFPLVGTHSYIVDEHIIYSLVLLFFITSRAGEIFGLDKYI